VEGAGLFTQDAGPLTFREAAYVGRELLPEGDTALRPVTDGQSGEASPTHAPPADNGDEQLLRGRVYGHDHGDPDPGPRPGQTYAALVGGPLDGLLLDITGWRPEEVDEGAVLPTELSRWPGVRVPYDPDRYESRTSGPGKCLFLNSGSAMPVRDRSGVGRGGAPFGSRDACGP
jgi:hypothetical protein